ncbi:hypothetical protein COE25_01930 [Bacillus sp. AFS031507]|nr:hypothetical protein COE25_01930 [Bacillus sp. AFS031507]
MKLLNQENYTITIEVFHHKFENLLNFTKLYNNLLCLSKSSVKPLALDMGFTLLLFVRFFRIMHHFTFYEILWYNGIINRTPVLLKRKKRREEGREVLHDGIQVIVREES